MFFFSAFSCSSGAGQTWFISRVTWHQLQTPMIVLKTLENRLLQINLSLNCLCEVTHSSNSISIDIIRLSPFSFCVILENLRMNPRSTHRNSGAFSFLLNVDTVMTDLRSFVPQNWTKTECTQTGLYSVSRSEMYAGANREKGRI